MITVLGKGGISATVVADSISEGGARITTFELEYPRFIHSEFMTHRQFSRNAASSRAIPVEKVMERVEYNPATPIHWGKNRSGMQAEEELSFTGKILAKIAWKCSASAAVKYATKLHKNGLHKQIVNRILEPYQMIKVVCTATEYENFFYLRCHKDAQPEIAELARCMREARATSAPQELKVGEWHLPYYKGGYGDGVWKSSNYMNENMEDVDSKHGGITLQDAVKISASMCAQVSYRKSDDSVEKAIRIYDQLVGMKPVHASPFEHQATPVHPTPEIARGYLENVRGITHKDRNGSYWSGNFKGWVQNRQLIEGNVYED